MKIHSPLLAIAAGVALGLASVEVGANSLRADADMTLVSRHLETMEYMAAMSSPYMCVWEVGYDFVGNDLKSVAGADADCCGKCRDTAGCTAFSWSDHNGGTCWLKSGRGTVVVSANVKSAAVIYPSPTEYPPCGALDADTDYAGYDIANVRMLKPQDCCAECSRVPGCKAFTHTDHNGGTCWLKSKRGNMVYKAGARSGVNYGVTQQPRCGLEAGIDYVGNDIGSAPATKAEDCCAKCQAFAGCRAFSWTTQSGGTCYFKNRKDATVAKAGVTSAAVFPNPAAPSCVMQMNVDFYGNDIGNAPSADAYGCCSICMKTAGCKAFSWTNQNGGTCWLKSTKGDALGNPNAMSAVV